MRKPAAPAPGHTPGDDQPPDWPDEWVRSLSDDSLTQTSSAAIFQRGKAYARSGAVEVLDEDAMPEPAVRAQVTGSMRYSTEVWIEDDDIAGSCDCTHASGGWFCKHQLALALVWRDRRAGSAPSDQAPTHMPLQRGSKDLGGAEAGRRALHDFLHNQGAALLADKLLELAHRDADIDLELQHWRKASGLGEEPAAAKHLIGEMLATGSDFVTWNESASYVRRAEAALPLLQQARQRDAAGAVALCLHAMRCVWHVLQQADDSNGDIGELCQAMGTEWVLSLQAAGPQEAGFGDIYLQVQLEDPFGCFDAAPAEAAMGGAALARYRDLLGLRWRHARNGVLALKAEHAARMARQRGRGPVYDDSAERGLRLWTLERLHLAQLQAAGQVDEALAVLREDLTDEYRHSAVVRFLEQHGRFREAFAQATQNCKAFPDNWRLQDDLLRCHERESLTAEAPLLRRQQFEREPGVERFLRKTASTSRVSSA